MIIAETKTPVTIPAAAPRPENPAPIPFAVILNPKINEVTIVQTKVRMLV